MKSLFPISPGAIKQPSLIRLEEVQRRTGMSRSTIYRWMQEGKFPRSRSLGGRIAAWSEAEVEAWIHVALDG
jgi:prophage regulatory protein